MKAPLRISILLLSFVLVTSCVSTPVENPVLAGVLEIERHPNAIKLSKITNNDADCEPPGSYCQLGSVFCEVITDKEEASDALHYYKKELNKIGWVTVKKDKLLNNKSFEFKSSLRNNRKNKTTLHLHQYGSRDHSIETHQVCFNFYEDENYEGPSDVINALKALEKNNL